MKDSLSISAASAETGLSPKQLREYEAKGYINEPIKIRCGSISYRYFSPEHIADIKIFTKYLKQGFRLPVAAIKAFEEIDQGKEVSDE